MSTQPKIIRHLLACMVPARQANLGLFAFWMICSGWGSEMAIAQTILPANDGVGSIVTPVGNQLNITGGQVSGDSQNLFHSFQRFGLSPDQTANFVITPNIQNILGRVTGGNPSTIEGLLRVTGGNANLVLMNPSGILFGQTAKLDIPGSFWATTANGIQFGDRWLNAIGNNEYSTLLGNPSGFTWTMENPGAIVNAGTLTVNPGQSLGLLGGTVVNTGQLNAPGGAILVQSVPGNRVIRLHRPGSLLSLEVTPIAQGDSVNPWRLPIVSLPQLLANHSGQNATGLTVNAQGNVELTGSGIQVSSETGSTTLSGNVSSASNVGGTVNVLGDRVSLINARVDASGNGNGGTVQIGGAYRGDSKLPSAMQTSVDANSTILADSRDRGEGGSVVLWAKDRTVFSGKISARGGDRAGNGGFIEVSGKEYLTFQGKVDVGASQGKGGTILLDPRNIYIVDNNTSPPVGASDQVINVTTLFGLGNASDYILEADENIEVAPNLRLDFGRGEGSITFQADANGDRIGSFIMQPSSTIVAPTTIGRPGRSINILGESIEVGNINTRSGSSPLGASAGSVNLIAKGNITVGYISAFADSDGTTRNPGSGGNILIESSEGTINAQYGGLSTAAGNGPGGNITLRAKGDILTSTITTNSIAGDSPGSGNLEITSSEGRVDLSAVGVSSSDGITPTQDGLVVGSVGQKSGNLEIQAKGTVTLPRIEGGSGAGDGSSIKISSSDGNIEFIPGSPAISIKSDNASSGTLILSAPKGTVKIPGVVGNSVTGSGGRVEITGGTGIELDGDINTEGLGTSGEIKLNSAVILTKDVTINSGNQNTTFSGTITGNHALSIAKANQVNFNSDISIGKLESNAEITNIAGNITSNNQPIVFNKAVILSAPSTFDAGTGSIAIGTSLNAANNPLILKADKVNINGDMSGNNTLTISPSTPDRNFEIGTKNENSLSFTSSEIAKIRGFSSVKYLANSGGNIIVSAPVSFSSPTILDPSRGSVFLNANVISTNQNLTFGNTILSQDVIVNTGNGNLTFNGTIDSQRDGAYQLTVSTGQGNTQFNGIVGRSNQRLRSINIASANQVLTNGGINITTGDLTLASPIVLLGNSTFSTTTGNLKVGNITAQGTADLSLQAPTGIVQTGNLSTVSATGNSGSVSIIARESVTTGKIDTSSTTGNAGNVFIDPLNDVVIDSINAQALGGGTGGNVEIFTQRYVRAGGTFIDRFGRVASISTADGGTGGNVLITHDGGARFTPFDIGFGDTNGLAGAITTGANNSILPIQIFPGPYQQGNIQIVTSPQFSNILSTIVPEGKIPELLELRRKEEGFGIDRYFTNQLEELFRNQRNNVTVIKSIDEIQDELRKVENAIGVRPAVIYAVFLPDRISDESILYNFPRKIEPKPTDNLYLVLVTGYAKPTVYKTSDSSSGKGVTREKAQRNISQLKSKIIDERTKNWTGEDTFGITFHQWLVAPLQEELKKWKIQNLTFILDQYLRSTPIAIMKQGDRFLLEDYSLGLMPSFSLTDTRFNPEFKRSKIMALGTSKFTIDQPLPAAPEELEIIRKYLGSRDVKGEDNLFKDEKFIPDSILNYRGNASIIHIASHANFDADGKDGKKENYIAFANKREDMDRLGQFKLYDPIVELLVLSACKTAIGNPKAELGFVGFAHEAGVKTSMGSLWQVNDRSTLALMAEFYDQLEKTDVKIKSQALQKAQLALLKGTTRIENGKLFYGNKVRELPKEIGDSSSFVNPYFWSAFTLVGSPW